MLLFTARYVRNLIRLALLMCLISETIQLQAQVVSARAGRICHVNGEVLCHRHDDKEVKQLEVGVMLNNGDYVFTTSNAHVEWSLTPDSYLKVAGDSQVQVREIDLEAMRFDVGRGEVLITLRSLENKASLVIHTPPALLTITKPGLYQIRVMGDGETEANVVKGELQYLDRGGKLNKVKKRRRVYFYKVEKSSPPQNSEATPISSFSTSTILRRDLECLVE